MPSIPKAPTVAVVGATGAAGQTLLELLHARRFPLGELRALASARSAGSTVRFAGAELPVHEAGPAALAGADLVFFAATGELSKSLGPIAVEQGAVVIDKSASFRIRDDVPLVVPEINAAELERHRGLIACPNCTTTGLVMALEPIRRAAGLSRVVVTTLQAASGAGQPGLSELQAQTRALVAQQPLACETFPAPLAHNVLPLCERFTDNGYSTEELKLAQETRKVLGLPQLPISVTCVRVPVPVGHSASVYLETERPLSPEQARAALSIFDGVRVLDDPASNLFPTPAEAAGRDEVLVGRVRRDLQGEGLWLWQTGDNLRKGAALNAVQIAEALLGRA